MGSRAAYSEVGGVCPLSVLLYLIPNSSEDSDTREGYMGPQGPGKGYQDQSTSDFRARELGLKLALRQRPRGRWVDLRVTQLTIGCKRSRPSLCMSQ